MPVFPGVCDSKLFDAVYVDALAMADDDFEALDDAGDALGPADAETEGGAAGGGSVMDSVRDWLNRKRSWILIIGVSISTAVFGSVMLSLRSEAKAVAEAEKGALRDLAVEMLGYEVKISQIYQLIPMRGGKRMTVGLDIVLVLGQLPEEQVEGADRPTPDEIQLFINVLNDMEPRIRSRVNQLLQQVPPERFGSADVLKTIKEDVKTYVNDVLDGLDFGKGLRKGIGKRRVTDVLLPMFVRQMMR